MRRQGVQALARLRDGARRAARPGGPIAHGALILVAGVLLILPGFFTDASGCCCWSRRCGAALIALGRVAGHGAGGDLRAARRAAAAPAAGETIEARLRGGRRRPAAARGAAPAGPGRSRLTARAL